MDIALRGPDSQEIMHRRMLAASLAYYNTHTLMGPPEEPYKGKFICNDHVLEWDTLIQNHKRVLIKAARDHGKSFAISVGYSLWKADVNHPGTLLYLFSANQTLAEERLSEVYFQLDRNPKLAHLTNDKTKRTAREAVLTTGSIIRARGWGVRVRGGHPHEIVCDDILDDQAIYSETIRRRATEYFFSVPSNMVTPGGQIVVIGTPFHHSDVYTVIERTGKYVVKVYPSKGDNGALFSERYSLPALKEKEKEIGPSRFAREYMCCRPGTMIETVKGAARIEDVSVGDLVLTHTGSWSPVLRTSKREHCGIIRRIKGRLHVTPEHPVWTQEGFVEAAKVVNGDLVQFPVPKEFAPAPAVVSFSDGCTVPYLVTAGGDRMYSRGSAKHLRSGSVGKSGAKSVPVELPFTPLLMRLFGLWLAEGHATKKILAWSFGSHEEHTLANEVVEGVETLWGLRARIVKHPKDNALTVSVGSRVLCDYFRRVFGTGSSKKRIPLGFRDLSPDLLFHLCLGYIDGDGHVESCGQVRVSSVSEFLLRDVQFLLARCGMASTIRIAHPGGVQIIQGRKCTCLPSWCLNVDGGAGEAIISRKLPDRPFTWSRIHTTLGDVEYDGEVHNLEVEGDNSYVADGIAVHNCIPLTDEASYFPTHLFDGPGIRLPYTLGMPWTYWHEQGCERYTGVDIAMSTEVGADYCVVFTIAVNAEGERFIANIRRGRGWSLQRQLDELQAENELMKPCVFHIESNQAQRLITDEARTRLGLPLRYFFTTGVQPKKDWTRGMTTLSANKHALDRGVPSLRLSLEAKKWRIPRGDAHSIEMTDIWIGEMNLISYQDAKIISVGEHDDAVMASWFAEVAAQLGGAQSFVFVDNEPEKPKDLQGARIPDRFKSPVPSAETSEEYPEFDPFGLSGDDKVFS